MLNKLHFSSSTKPANRRLIVIQLKGAIVEQEEKGDTYYI